MPAAPPVATEAQPAPWRASIRTRAVALAAAALLAHIAFSAIAAAAMYWGYPHRIYDIRRWPETKNESLEERRRLQSQLINAFLASRRSDLLFVGSSFTFGYPWQEEVIFSRIAGRGTNASVIGLGLTGIHDLVLCNLEDKHPRSLVIEIPVVASVKYPKYQFECERSAIDGYFSFALRHPVGTGWFPFLWDNEAYAKPDERIKVSAVPADYFVRAFNRDNFAYQIVRTLTKARTVADKVYVFPSPIYVPGVDAVGHDAKAVREQLDFAVATCRKVPGIVCLDPSAFYDKTEYFYNMTHLNQRGHRAMAEWLAGFVGDDQKLK